MPPRAPQAFSRPRQAGCPRCPRAAGARGGAVPRAARAPERLEATEAASEQQVTWVWTFSEVTPPHPPPHPCSTWGFLCVLGEAGVVWSFSCFWVCFFRCLLLLVGWLACSGCFPATQVTAGGGPHRLAATHRQRPGGGEHPTLAAGLGGSGGSKRGGG